MAIYIAVAVIVLVIVLLVLRRMTRAGEPTDSVKGIDTESPPGPIRNDDRP